MFLINLYKHNKIFVQTITAVEEYKIAKERYDDEKALAKNLVCHVL